MVVLKVVGRVWSPWFILLALQAFPWLSVVAMDSETVGFTV
jgi:hypothetical protein